MRLLALSDIGTSGSVLLLYHTDRGGSGISAGWAPNERGHVETVQALITGGADVNKATYRGGQESGVHGCEECPCTPLSRAAEKGHLEIVEALIAAGAKEESALEPTVPPTEESALQRAAARGAARLVGRLL